MIQYTIDTLTCGHCAKRVGAAIAAVAPQANVEIDVPARQVRIDAADALEPALRAGLAEAGYPPRAGATPPTA